MNIHDLLRNPLIKWAGIAIILYFALFANTKDPRTLGSRLSSENVKKGLSDVKEKTSFIATSVKEAKKQVAQQQNSAPTTTAPNSSEATATSTTACGDKSSTTNPNCNQ